MTRVRREQAALRRHLLASCLRCEMCGRRLPASLLVAAHIVPRRSLVEEALRNLQAIAFLVCVLACDTLFEWGYVTVGSEGIIQPGIPTQEPALGKVVDTGGWSMQRLHSSDGCGLR